jgi:hypothetical protein
MAFWWFGQAAVIVNFWDFMKLLLVMEKDGSFPMRQTKMAFWWSGQATMIVIFLGFYETFVGYGEGR